MATVDSKIPATVAAPNYVPGARGRMLASSSYVAGSRSGQLFGAWHPNNRSADSAILPDRALVDRRVRDLTRNSGWVSGGIRKKVDKFIGAKIRPQFKPDWRALGITPEQAVEVARQMESAFWLAAHNPMKSIDAAKRVNFGTMARILFWHWIQDGRCLAIPLWLNRYGSLFRTCFMLVDPLRLSNPQGEPESQKMRGGLEFDQYGCITAYHIRNAHPDDTYADSSLDRSTWTRIPAYTRWGRPKVIYGIEQRQAEQSQGISQLVAGLKKIRMLENYDDLELGAAALNAFFAMQVQSDLSSEAVFKGLGTAPVGDEADQLATLAEFTAFNAQIWESNATALRDQNVVHLGVGEKLETIEANRAQANFVDAERQWLRYFASSLPGLTVEELTNDWTQTAYVGIRAALSAASYALMSEREMFADQVLTPMVDLIVEEAIDLGLVTLPAGAPSYELMRGAWCRVEWVGPAAMVVDPQKEANALRIRLESGIDTLEDILADRGRDPEDHIAQLEREENLRRDAELPSALKVQAGAGPVAGEERAGAEDDGDALRGGEF